MRVRLDSIGCRLNISEIEALARQFVRAGHRVVGPGDPADLVVFNTCAVTHMAGRKSRQIVRQLRRANPRAAIVVTGCYAELEPDALHALGVDRVVGNQDKDRLPAILAAEGLLTPGDPLPADDATAFDLPAEHSHTRAFVKVQDGCDNKCTFCIVTVARGAGRSRPLAEVVDHVQRLVDQGYHEAVLSGVHLGSYGHDLGDARGLHTLVRAILTHTDLPRLRLSSLEPWDLDAAFFALWADSRLQPHLHLPLQSGSDATLRRMARKTTRASYRRLLAEARAAIPGVAISTDVIVGFPGESAAQHAESLAFIEEMAFSRLHIFRYSRRKGTAAAGMPGHLGKAVLAERSQQMHELGARLEQAFMQRVVGRTVPVLWEHSEPFGFGQRWSGLSPRYLRVLLETTTTRDLRNTVTPTTLQAVQPGALIGHVPGLSPAPPATLRPLNILS